MSGFQFCVLMRSLNVQISMFMILLLSFVLFLQWFVLFILSNFNVMVFMYFIIFYFVIFLLASPLPMNRKGRDQNWMERWGGTGRNRGRGIVMRMYYMRRESVSKRKNRVTCLASPLPDLNISMA